MAKKGLRVGIVIAGCVTERLVLLLLGADWRRRIYHGHVVQNGSGIGRRNIGSSTFADSQKTSDPVTLRYHKFKYYHWYEIYLVKNSGVYYVLFS